MDAFRLGVGHLGCVQRRNGIDNCHTNKKTGMASASAEIDDDGGSDDEDRTADPAAEHVRHPASLPAVQQDEPDEREREEEMQGGDEGDQHSSSSPSGLSREVQ